MKKLITFFATLLISLSAIFALPGFEPQIKDMPGEYVYYQDATFLHESYVGFLMYDEQTYAARYYSPKNSKDSLPEKEVKIFFTIDPKSDYLKLTGEKVICKDGVFGSQDTEIVNYLHDMIYELNARRIKAKENSSSTENFMQFGGNVTLEYNSLVPLFNLMSIYEEKTGKKVFFVATAGRLLSSQDTAFDDFKGFPKENLDEEHKNIKIKKSSTKKIQTQDGITFDLDKNWSQKMENLFVYDDYAIIAFAPLPNEQLYFVNRQMLLSSGSSFLNWQTVKSSAWNANQKKCTVEGIFYDAETSSVTKSIKIVTPTENGYSFFSLTTFLSIYEKNKKYFDAIIKSYGTNN